MGRAQRERHFKRAPLIYSRNPHYRKKRKKTLALLSRVVEINCRKSAELVDQLLISARARLKTICMPTLEVDNGIFSQAVFGSHWHVAASLCVLVIGDRELQSCTLWNFKNRITVVPRYLSVILNNFLQYLDPSILILNSTLDLLNCYIIIKGTDKFTVLQGTLILKLGYLQPIASNLHQKYSKWWNTNKYS